MSETPPVKNILFVQDSSPCIRTIKYATALQAQGLQIHLVHRNKTPDEAFGYGNSLFATLTRLPASYPQSVGIIKRLINTIGIDILHYHNYPDKLGAQLIKERMSVPVIYDQHDFMSLKKRFFIWRYYYERVCNEKNDGAIYITENYKRLVQEKYLVNTNSIVFPNYGSSSMFLSQQEFLPKISQSDNKIHLVYVGLITQHKNKVKYLVDVFKELCARGLYIHIYPTRNKQYEEYEKIPNLFLHKQLPVFKLIKEMSQYDAGIAFLNNTIPSYKKREESKYGFWNKMNDCLMAGIPALTLDYYSDMSSFIKQNGFGISAENLADISDEFIKKLDLKKISENIIANRKNWSMENQIQVVIDFYQKTTEQFHAKA